MEDPRATYNRTWCDDCDCPVPRSEMDKHVIGNQHRQSTQDHFSSGSSFSSCGIERVVSAEVIHFSQATVAREFRDGTSLKEGIRNLRNGCDYPLEVDIVNGQYVAINNRTLYCYKMVKRQNVRVEIVVGRLDELNRRMCGRFVTVRGG